IVDASASAPGPPPFSSMNSTPEERRQLRALLWQSHLLVAPPTQPRYGLRRATGIETAIFDSVTEDSRSLFQAKPGKTLNFDPKHPIADSFLRLAALPTFALDRLSRYEYILWRQARQIVFMLESLRRRKHEIRRVRFPFSFR